MISPLAKIRIIDDDPAMLESWKFLLNSLGCDVVTYNSAKEFLEKDDPHPMGCILLDVRMPEMSGLELQELLKETKNELPIVFCSGHGTIDMAVLAVRKGAVDFLEKPVEVERLVESLERACEKDAQRVEAQTLSLREKEKVDSLTHREKKWRRLWLTALLTEQPGLSWVFRKKPFKSTEVHYVKNLEFDLRLKFPKSLKNIIFKRICCAEHPVSCRQMVSPSLLKFCKF